MGYSLSVCPWTALLCQPAQRSWLHVSRCIVTVCVSQRQHCLLTLLVRPRARQHGVPAHNGLLLRPNQSGRLAGRKLVDSMTACLRL